MKSKSIKSFLMLCCLVFGGQFFLFSVEEPLELPLLTNAKGDIIEEPVSEIQMRALTASDEADIRDWYNLSPEADAIEGSSVDRAYSEFKLKDSKKYCGEPVVVAVIDSGVDIHHEDLQGKIWVNEFEIPDNGIDDDMNGYVDDIYGWNFIGGRDGSHVDHDTLEVTREYVRYLKKLADGVVLTEKEKIYYEKVSAEYKAQYDRSKRIYDLAVTSKQDSITARKVLADLLGLTDFSKAALEKITSTDPRVVAAKTRLIEILNRFRTYARIDLYINYYYDRVTYYYNTEFDPRKDIVKDDPNDLYEWNYGNNDVIGPDSSHGTHVAGIIAADRNNALGIKGIADNVKIMVLRTVPNGDERDKDVANSIRYAVDNGADIINMSFGKGYSPYKDVVDEAFIYAEMHGVLIVHAAGNDSANIDTTPNFPNRHIASFPGFTLDTFVEVGASAYTKGETMVASFSNFGKENVDIFAPGYRILSTVPGNNYAAYSGTSMACPVFSGVAALLLSQHPYLSGLELKHLLLRTARKYPDLMVNSPADQTQKVPFKDLSTTGAVVDAYKVLDLLKW